MTISTNALSATEIVFTLIKSGLLNVRGSVCLGKIGAGFSFAMESLIGISLTILLAVQTWNIPSPDILIRSGAITIFITEIFAVVTEASLIWAKWKNEGTQDLRKGRIRREVLKFLSLATGVSALIVSIMYERRGSRLHIVDSPFSIPFVRGVLGILGFALTCTILIFLFSFVFKKHLRLRANVSTAFLVVGTLFSIVVVFGGWFEGEFSWGGKPIDPFYFNFDVGYSIFCTAVASAFTAIAAWGMPDFKAHGCIQPAHVKMLEVAAMGMTGPTMVLGMTSISRNNAKQIMQTVLPQLGAITIPLLFSYVLALFHRDRIIRNETEEKVWA